MPPAEKKNILAGPEYGFASIAPIDYPDVLMLSQEETAFLDIPETRGQRKENRNAEGH